LYVKSDADPMTETSLASLRLASMEAPGKRLGRFSVERRFAAALQF
jgi:hypothetical protein